MVGLVWEWTLDFDAYAIAADGDFSCTGAAARAGDPADYPAFMRYSMRASSQSELHRQKSRLSLRGRRAINRRALFVALGLGVAIAANQRAMIGPNARPIAAVPNGWAANKASRIAAARRPLIKGGSKTDC